MAVLFPTVETRAPGLLVTRYEWPHLLQPEVQGELVSRCREESRRGPVGLAFVLADRIHEVPADVRPFWRAMVEHPENRIAAMAIVTTSWCVEVEAMAFGVTNAMHGTGPRVAVFPEEGEGVAWVRAALASEPLRDAPRERAIARDMGAGPPPGETRATPGCTLASLE